MLELASGYLMGQARQSGLMSEQPVNLLGGTQMDQNMQAPNVNAATIQQVGHVIQGLASQFQGGAGV